MRLSSLINYPLHFFGLKIARIPIPPEKKNETIDIQAETSFLKHYQKVKPFTLTTVEKCFALYKSVQYIIENNIPGDFVECGVWRGGSAMLMAYTLLEMGITDRRLLLYDTFSGMTAPGPEDGIIEKQRWEENKIDESTNNWCLSPIEDVTLNMHATGYPTDKIQFITGKVEETIPNTISEKIALLRLDTDWYESTYHELTHLYPIVSKYGIAILDDYGAWQGSQRAIDKYFSGIPYTFFNRIDYAGRIVIKIDESR